MTESAEVKPKIVRKHPLANCEACPLSAPEVPCVQSSGLNSSVAFVSRSPGSYDARVGTPFANPRGSKAVLDHLLGRHGVKRDNVLLTNVVLCQTDDPPKEAIKACAPRLEMEIAECDLVIAGGAEATSALTSYRTVSKSRGFSIHRRSPVSSKQQRVVVTNNPAAVIRNSDLYPDLVRDFKRAFDPLPPPVYPKVTIIDDVEQAKKLVTEINADDRDLISFDLEWSGTDIYAVGFALSEDKAVTLTREVLEDKLFVENHLKPLFETTEDNEEGIELPLTNNEDGRYKALISKSDLRKVTKNYRQWHAHVGPTGKVYIVSQGTYLHRFIMEPDDGMEVDHINNNGQDCRRSNMRICTRSQNHAAKKTSRTDAYTGVYYDGGSYVTKAKINQESITIGRFKTEIEAAKARDIFMRDKFGEFASLNFPFRPRRWLAHNGKADTKILRRNGINAYISEDTFLMSYDLDERPGYHSLEYLLSEHFGWSDYEPASVKHFKTKGEFLAPERKSRYELYKYNSMDTAGTLQLYNKFTNEGGLDEEHYRRLLKAADAFTTVELNGFNYDVEKALNLNEAVVIPRLYELTDELRDISQHSLLNPRSNKQVSSVWYNEWGLKHSLKDKPKKKFSTSVGKEVREEIEGDRIMCNPLHRGKLKLFNQEFGHFQKISKMQDSFIEGLVIRVQKDGKLYCNFNVAGTSTGRTSSSDPNFQNIMREGYEDIPGIRTLFLPSPGSKIVSGDLSQAELRACAKQSGDGALLSIYRDSERSLHRERAAAFYGENYTKEEYVKAKNINFGVTYGQGADAFAQMYHMPKSEAQAYIDSWWKEFSTLKDWTKEVANKAIKEGVVRSPFGHRRRFHLITDENIGEIRREAVSILGQNPAAWITICAIIELIEAGVRVVATVHDSIVADVPEDEAIQTAQFMREVMERQSVKELGWARDDIPFLADVSMGPNWGELEDIGVEQIAA